MRSDGLERRSAQTALYEVCQTLLRLIAPIVTFTADEAWGYFNGNSDFGYEKSIHLEDFPVVVEQYQDNTLQQDFDVLFKVREAIQAELEKCRQQKIIGQSLDAQVLLSIGSQNPTAAILKKYNKELSEYFIVSAVHLNILECAYADLAIAVKHADGVRCPRTWRWVDKLVNVKGFGEVSERCVEVLQAWKSKS